MSRAYLGGFVVIAAIAVGAVDYINQSRHAGAAPGAFGASDYVSTISGRFMGREAAPAAGMARAAASAPESGSVPPKAANGGDGGVAAAAGTAKAGAAPASVPAGGGILSMVGGFFGGGTSPDAGTPEPAAPEAVKPVASSGGFGGDCSVTMGVKRCSLGGG